MTNKWKAQKKKGKVPPPALRTSWKDHPIVIAAVAVTATVGICILIGTQVVLPTITAALNNRVYQLNSRIRSLQGEKEIVQSHENQIINEKDGLAKRIASLESELEGEKSALHIAQMGNLFTPGDPYPIGLGQVRIGDSIEKLTSTYSKDLLDTTNPDYYSLKAPHAVFKGVTYYFDEKAKKITHINFSAGMIVGPKDQWFLLSKLTEAFGSPKTWSRKGYYSWKVGGTRLYFDNNLSPNGYLVMQSEYRPGYWPDN